VLVVQVDPVGVQIAERTLDARAHVLRTAVRAAGHRAVVVHRGAFPPALDGASSLRMADRRKDPLPSGRRCHAFLQFVDNGERRSGPGHLSGGPRRCERLRGGPAREFGCAGESSPRPVRLRPVTARRRSALTESDGPGGRRFPAESPRTSQGISVHDGHRVRNAAKTLATGRSPAVGREPDRYR
jgi:hypothetical protein